jgi:hypothetical protein
MATKPMKSTGAVPMKKVRAMGNMNATAPGGMTPAAPAKKAAMPFKKGGKAC